MTSTHLALDDQIRHIAGHLAHEPLHSDRQAAVLANVVGRLHDLADQLTDLGLTQREAVAEQRLANDLFAAVRMRFQVMSPVTFDELAYVREEGLQLQIDETPAGYSFTLVDR